MKFVIAACVLYFATVNVVFGDFDYGTFDPPLNFILNANYTSDNMTVITRSDDGQGTKEVTSQNTTHVVKTTGEQVNTTDTLKRDQK